MSAVTRAWARAATKTGQPIQLSIARFSKITVEMIQIRLAGRRGVLSGQVQGISDGESVYCGSKIYPQQAVKPADVVKVPEVHLSVFVPF